MTNEEALVILWDYRNYRKRRKLFESTRKLQEDAYHTLRNAIAKLNDYEIALEALAKKKPVVSSDYSKGEYSVADYLARLNAFITDVSTLDNAVVSAVYHKFIEDKCRFCPLEGFDEYPPKGDGK